MSLYQSCSNGLARLHNMPEEANDRTPYEPMHVFSNNFTEVFSIKTAQAASLHCTRWLSEEKTLNDFLL